MSACMGGWCAERYRCIRYSSGSEQTAPKDIHERLCLRGAEQPLLRAWHRPVVDRAALEARRAEAAKLVAHAVAQWEVA